MSLIARLPVGGIAALHIYILSLEMFYWTGPRARRAFNLTAEFAAQTKTLAANQGLYNGFLAAGLIWGLAHPVPAFATQIQLFFLGCVGVAGLYGSATVGRKILFIQTVPAVVAGALVLLTG